MLIPGLVFAVVAASICIAYWVFVLEPEKRQRLRLRRRLKQEDPTQANVRLLKNPDTLSTIEPFDALLKRFIGIVGPLKRMVDDSGVAVSVGSFLLLSLASMFGVSAAGWIYTGIAWAGAAGAAVGLFLPYVVIKQMRTMRIRKFEEQFPEAIELISRSMRAGHAFATGLQMVAEEMPAPAGPEFKLLYERQNYGAQLPDALRTFASRIPSLDARFFVTAVLTQREAGGNLSEVLDRLAGVMRERFRIKREVRVKSAHGRMTAYVLAGMPPVLAAMMFSSSPDQFNLLLTDPLGVRMIIVGLILEAIGFLIVRRLVDIQY
jgi:tight adherence protein B